MNLNPVRSQPMLGSASSQRSGLNFEDKTEKLLQLELIQLIKNTSKEADIDAHNPFVRDILEEKAKEYIEALNRFSDSNTLSYWEQKKTKKRIFTLVADYDKNAQEMIKNWGRLFEKPKVSKKVKLKNTPSPLGNELIAKELGYSDVEESHWENAHSNPFLNAKAVPSKKRSKEDARKIKEHTEVRLPLSLDGTLPFMSQLKETLRQLNKIQENKGGQAEEAIQQEKEAVMENLRQASLFEVPHQFVQAHSASTKRHKLLTPPNLLEAFPNRATEAKEVPVLKPKPFKEDPDLSPEGRQWLEELLNPPNTINVMHGVDPETFLDTTTFKYNDPDLGSVTISANGSSSDSPRRRAKGSKGKGDGVFVPAMTAEQEATRQARLGKARSKPPVTLAGYRKVWEINNAKYLQPYSLTPNLKVPNPSSDNAKQVPLKYITVKNNSNGRYLEWQKTDGTTEQRDLPESMKGSKVNTKAPDIQSLFD